MKKRKVRASGILLSLTSLPSEYGIGTMGKAARDFVDFLKSASQTYWQMLPVGPTGYGNSPYQSYSSFAGNPYLIDLALLCEEGLLTEEECSAIDWGHDPKRVDYAAIEKNRLSLLRTAFERGRNDAAVAQFRADNAEWIEDYALYMGIKNRMDLRPWSMWDEDIKRREPEAMARWREEVKDDVDFYCFIQYHFYKQWNALRDYAHKNGVYLIGDIPIYAAMDSADSWADGKVFLLDDNCDPIDVAGCPPDAFSATGQLWGNPIYNWDYLKETGYAWWIRRLRHITSMFDVTRIDHFRGFAGYYAIPYGSATAETGEWRVGPGMDFFRAVKKALGNINVIAEDLGYLTPDVRKLLKQSGFPGMKVLQFAFDSREESDYLPHNYDHNCVVYTGTHDNDTTRSWFDTADKNDVRHAKKYLNVRRKEDGAWAFIRCAMMSTANLCIIPMQDYLNLGGEARMNVPSTLGGINWQWRMTADAASPALADKILDLTTLTCR